MNQDIPGKSFLSVLLNVLVVLSWYTVLSNPILLCWQLLAKLPFTSGSQKTWEWDDPLLPQDLLTAWEIWEKELHYFLQITFPRCYTSKEMDAPTTVHDILIFCDSSENAYGAVAYLRSKNDKGQVEFSFIRYLSRLPKTLAICTKNGAMCSTNWCTPLWLA